jgi:hypothetical protein
MRFQNYEQNTHCLGYDLSERTATLPLHRPSRFASGNAHSAPPGRRGAQYCARNMFGMYYSIPIIMLGRWPKNADPGHSKPLSPVKWPGQQSYDSASTLRPSKLTYLCRSDRFTVRYESIAPAVGSIMGDLFCRQSTMHQGDGKCQKGMVRVNEMVIVSRS